MHRSLAWLAALTVLLVATGCGGAPDNDFLAPVADAAPDVPTLVPPPITEAGADTQPAQPLAFLSAAGVDFGLVDCGGAAPDNKSITLRNLGLAPLTWTAAMSASDVFAIVEPASGTIVPGSSATVTVSATAVASGALAGASVQSLLTITTNDPVHAKSDLPVRMTPGGGTLILTPPTSAFGTVPLNAQAPDIALTLTNAGNKPVSVAFAQPADAQFGLQWTTSPSAVTLQPGASVPGLGARFRPTASLVASSTASISATGVLCGATPIIKMTGEGIVGTASVSPGDVFFGNVDLQHDGCREDRARVEQRGRVVSVHGRPRAGHCLGLYVRAQQRHRERELVHRYHRHPQEGPGKLAHHARPLCRHPHHQHGWHPRRSAAYRVPPRDRPRRAPERLPAHAFVRRCDDPAEQKQRLSR